MKNENNMEKTQFLLKQIIGVFTAGMGYHYFLFRCIDSCSFKESVILLCSFVVLFCMVGTITELKNYNDYERIVYNVIPGYGLYTVFAYFECRRLLIITSLIVIWIVSTLYVLVLIFSPKYAKQGGHCFWEQIIDVSISIIKIMVRGLLIIMLIIAASNTCMPL